MMDFLGKLLDLLYPRRCTFCHCLMRSEGGVCADCRKKLPYTGELGREQKFSHVARCVSPLYYEGDVRASLHRYKFGNLTGYAAEYTDLLLKCLDESAVTCDSITWVPLSRRRLRKRGYDQARLLAEEISRRSGVPCEPMLKKLRDNPAQSRTGNAERRRANVAGIYACPDEALVKDKRVLLVDDIVTTGATLSECARVLKQSGAKLVCAVTVARARP